MIFNLKYFERCKKKDRYLVHRVENADYNEPRSVVNEQCFKKNWFLRYMSTIHLQFFEQQSRHFLDNLAD
jgi:hypothetical protein